MPLPPAYSQSSTGTTPTKYSGQNAAHTLSNVKARKHDSYRVQRRDDKWNCWITGMAITNDDRLLLADGGNSKIKLFSRHLIIGMFSLSLSSRPWDIAVTGDREAVINCDHEKKLLILDISDRKMSIKGTVKLPFTVRGISTFKDKLVVTSLSTSPAIVKLIDLRGRVYWTTDTDQQGQQLFYYPDYVTCYDDGGSAAVIVSDQDNDMLTVLNADTGDIIARRKVEGKDPHGVTTDTTGNIFVCYRRAGEVAVLTKDLSQEKVILSGKDGLRSQPQAIAYNASDNQLLVSHATSVNIDCFQL